MKYLISYLLLFCFSCTTYGQDWSIKVEADGYTGNQLFLAYYLANAQYVKDSAQLDGNTFVFSGSDTLHPGVYMVVFPPDNQFFQLLVGEREDHLSIKVKMDDLQHPRQIQGSKESNLFYEYIAFLQARRPLTDTLKKSMDSVEDTAQREEINKQIKAIDKEVREYQETIVTKHPGSLTALLVQSNLDVEIPAFEGTEEEKQKQHYLFVKSHFFDRLPMKDARFVRTPILQQKLDFYINKLTPQVADSLNASLDLILSKMDPSSEAFKIYLVYFLNQYAKSKIVGMDAVYVHLVEKYYAKGLATWTDSTQLTKILKNAETLKPLLIGKIAPDLLMLTKDNTPLRLHNVTAPYTILFFWDPDCGHCKKSMPDIIAFYKEYKPKGVEIFSVCTRIQEDVPKCWESIGELEGMGEWINVVDPYLRSRFKQIYDVRTTPQIYILDTDKKIVMKKIGTEQLKEVMDHLMESGS